ncbi:AAA family ATPase [Streptomyces sp. NPDC058394]|uniref:helix-turn-helix transcriptional regulator n=1 Tax=Streptomyces sp. NPDC058394 TaxID=3346477 RepID=UPI00365ECA43
MTSLLPLGARTEPVVGRDQDVAHIVDFLSSPGAGRALLLSGEAGVGKTVILDAVTRTMSQTDTRVLRAHGVQFEANVSYSGLNQALLPLRDALDDLSSLHRDALKVALGLGAGAPPDRLVVSNAALTLLQTASRRSPVLVVVDDLPWIDPASAAVFGFVARRLSGSRVSFLAASRTEADGFFEDSGLSTYPLQPLDEPSATKLVELRFPGLAHEVRRRVLDTAQGNPLALLELPSALSSNQRAALEALPTVLPLNRRLQSLFRSRIQNLPVHTRHLLLLATLNGNGDLGTLSVAARELNGDLDLKGLAPAEHDQLVRLEERTRQLVFRHPLISSAVIEATTGAERRAAHQALARVLTNEPERRAWHLGAAAIEPDESVAALLEEAAQQVINRGDAVAAIAALTRAADLSPLRRDRARRLAEAAYIGTDSAGALLSASALLEGVRRADPQHGRSLRSIAAAVQLQLNRDGDVARAHCQLVDAIEEGTHGYDAHDTSLIDAMHLLLLLCFYGGEATLWAPFHAALSRLRPQAPALLSAADKTFGDPARAGAAALEQLGHILDADLKESDPARIVRIGTASIYPDRLAALREPSWRVVRQGRDGGPVRRHLDGLMHLCLDGYHSGRWTEVAQLSDEGLHLCEASGYTFFAWYFQYNKALVAASRGELSTARSTADLMMDWATPRGVRAAVHHAHHVHAVASIANGDFDDAFLHATAVSPAGELAAYTPHALWLAFDLVESAVRTDRRTQAVAHVQALRAAGAASLSPRLSLLVGGCEALVTEDDEVAARLFAETLSAPYVNRWPFDVARVRLAQGERLRRARATTDAKAPLGGALQTFDELGASPWSARATLELRATGWNVPHARAPFGRKLTPQEREVAQLAAAGLTNKQIAERLFISHRTVGAHLYQTYPKLGIASRAALRDALTSLEI